MVQVIKMVKQLSNDNYVVNYFIGKKGKEKFYYIQVFKKNSELEQIHSELEPIALFKVNEYKSEKRLYDFRMDFGAKIVQDRNITLKNLGSYIKQTLIPAYKDPPKRSILGRVFNWR